MAYGRRYSYRRKNRRAAASLSTRRIFNNKSAKAQAKQIYALRRRLNRVYKNTKPEVKVVETQRTERIILPNLTESSFSYAHVLPQLGPNDDQRIGSVIRVVQPTLFLSAKYSAVTSSNPAPIYDLNLLNSGAALRIFAIQAKVPLNDIPTINSLLHNNISQSFQGVDNIANLRIPFEVGISTRFAVIYDKVKYFSANKPIYSKRINFRPKIRNLKWDPDNGGDSSFTYPVGSIFVYFVQGGLESGNVNVNTEGNDYTRITISYTQKLAYTDA